jgi:hypothetical protein
MCLCIFIFKDDVCTLIFHFDMKSVHDFIEFVLQKRY